MSRSRLIEHLSSIGFVGAIVVLIFLVTGWNAASRSTTTDESALYLSWSFIDFGNPLHRIAFKESLLLYLAHDTTRVDAILASIDDRRQEQFTTPLAKSGSTTNQFDAAALARIGLMYIQFLLVYLIVMILTYHAAQALALYRFVKWKQQRESPHKNLLHETSGIQGLRTFAAKGVRSIARAIAYAVLFAPAYVIAYTLRTRFDSASLPFMVALGVISNGLLITYANKLYALLVAESRKGYVETAMVKNLFSSYVWGTKEGIAPSALFRMRKRFPSHIFDQIYRNAHYQWIPSLKEHGSFLITGLIIIEMALNIQGHLCYELLQTILFRQFATAAVIGFAIFLAVKVTEMVVDAWHHRELRRYGNAE